MSGLQKPDTSLRTYRYVRLGIASTIVVIAVAVIAASFEGGIRDSISSYYYSGAREIFVASLVAVGFGFLVISGRGLQRFLLDLAALFAPLIGLLPGCELVGTECVSEGVVETVRVGIWTYAIVAIFVFAFAWIVRKRYSSEKVHLGSLFASFAPAVLVSALLFVGFYCSPGNHEWLFPWGHRVATVAFFLILIVVAFARGLDKKESTLTAPTELQHDFYFVAAGLMLVGLCGAIHFTLEGATGAPYPVLIFEAIALGTFSAFWFVQTFEKWNENDAAVAAVMEADAD